MDYFRVTINRLQSRGTVPPGQRAVSRRFLAPPSSSLQFQTTGTREATPYALQPQEHLQNLQTDITQLCEA